GSTVNLGAAVNALANTGSMNVGGARTIATTSLTGRLDQQAGGVWYVDADFATGRSDRIEATGTSFLGGEVSPLVSDLPSSFDQASLPSFTVLTSAGGLTSTGTTTTSVGVMRYRIEHAGNAVKVTLDDVSFNGPHSKSTGELSTNESKAADHLQRRWDSGELGGLKDHIVHVASLTSPHDYREALKDLAPESHQVHSAGAPQSAARFHRNLHSCPVFVGLTAQLSEESCTYSRGIWSTLKHSSDGRVTGYNQHEATYQIGGQKQIAPDWFLGGAGAYTDESLVAHDGQSSGTGDSYSAGLVVKRRIGAHWLLAGSLGYSYGTMDNQRLVSNAGVAMTASSTQKTHTYSSRLRGAYNFDFGQWYLRPALNLDVVHVRVPAYTETGAGALNMQFDSASDTQVGGTPEIEVGGRLDLGDAILRPYAGIGVTVWNDAKWSQSARLAAAPAGGPSIDSSFEGDQVVGRAELGLDLVHGSGMAFRAQYGAEMGSDFVSHTGSVRLGIRF
ncbi:MAG: autotransporter outer membrane beta-barrel domain-containing protein, partial [Sneathiellaceae bacterium]